jgi:hypothetical protein
LKDGPNTYYAVQVALRDLDGSLPIADTPPLVSLTVTEDGQKEWNELLVGPGIVDVIAHVLNDVRRLNNLCNELGDGKRRVVE